MTDEDLEVFFEQSNWLKNSTFMKMVLESKHQPDIGKIINGDWLAYEGLTEDSLKSFCLTLRCFLQTSDQISLNRVGNFAETWESDFAEHARGVASARADLQDFLREVCTAQLPGSTSTTNSEFFDTVFYGGIVHFNPNKREVCRKMIKSGLFSFFAFQSFRDALRAHQHCIQVVAYHCVGYLLQKKGVIQA